MDTGSSVPQALPTPTGTLSDQIIDTAEAVLEDLSSEALVEYETGPLTSMPKSKEAAAISSSERHELPAA